MADLATEFAPADRASHSGLQIDAQRIAAAWKVADLLDYVPDMVMILNRERQVVYANKAVLDFVGASALQSVLGSRPGELFGCQHAHETAGGCGTTRFCRYCGAARAILQSQAGDHAIEECRLMVNAAGGEHALDLRVWAMPLELEGDRFTFYAVVDIADEKRRTFLENIFLHDVMNTASTLRGFSTLLAENRDDRFESDACIDRIASLSDWMVEEIDAHKQLVAAESGELEPGFEYTGSRSVLDAILSAYGKPELLNGRRLHIAGESVDVQFETDPRLLRRVLWNLVRNALEGSAPGEMVTIACWVHDDRIAFSVRNPTYIPENIRLQIFNRSFSTKGAGRGLGTYSVKFLTERYLAGEVSFTSSEANGTTFVVDYPLRRSAVPSTTIG